MGCRDVPSTGRLGCRALPREGGICSAMPGSNIRITPTCSNGKVENLWRAGGQMICQGNDRCWLLGD
jgi:hypothetical protein